MFGIVCEMHGHQSSREKFSGGGRDYDKVWDGGCRLRCLLVQWQAKWKGAYSHKPMAAWLRILLSSFDSYVA
jgi:hypothetical protein